MARRHSRLAGRRQLGCIFSGKHVVDYALAILFLVLYYVRPHEWNATMASLQPITKVLALALAVLLFRAGRRLHWRPDRILGDLLTTPNDWILLALTLWVLHAAADAGTTWSAFYPLLAYYVVVQHALSSPRRIEGFLWVWLGLLLFISVMAVLSEYDIDPFGSASYTHGMYKGRLALNLSIFNNPNALGHSVVLILPMIYFLGIWHRVLLLKELALPLYIMPFWCLFWTESKGAYVSGAAGILASQTFGRPKWFQAVMVLLAYGVGMSALMLLPRMHELQSIRDDAGVKGRLFAWNFAWQSFETEPKGLGFEQFRRRVPEYTEGRMRLRKVTHSSYVEVAAELGKCGLYLWLGVLYYSLKVLVRAKTQTDQEERIRRLLFSLVVIYMASSWTTNISYRGTFLIQTGVIAAFARHLRRRQPGGNGPGHGLGDGVVLAVPSESGEPVLDVAVRVDGATAEGEEGAQGLPAAPWWHPLVQWLHWRTLGPILLDLALIYLMYRVVIRAWLYFMCEWTGV